MTGFNHWLYHNDGEHYEGLREEFFEGGGEAGDFMDWAEEKYAAEKKEKAERTAALPPTKWPTKGLKVCTDLFSNELYHYRDAAEAFATATAQVAKVKGDEYGQDVRDRVQAYFVSCTAHLDESARALAAAVDTAAKAADPRTKAEVPK
jgi:hypothetical protein